MSIANLLIGKKPEAKPAAANETVEQRPLTPMELIDTIASAEFVHEEQGVEHDTTGVGSQKDGEHPGQEAMKDGKSGNASSPTQAPVSSGAKKTKGQVADTPSSGSGNPVGYGKK